MPIRSRGGQKKSPPRGGDFPGGYCWVRLVCGGRSPSRRAQRPGGAACQAPEQPACPSPKGCTYSRPTGQLGRCPLTVTSAGGEAARERRQIKPLPLATLPKWRSTDCRYSPRLIQRFHRGDPWMPGQRKPAHNNDVRNGPANNQSVITALAAPQLPTKLVVQPNDVPLPSC